MALVDHVVGGAPHIPARSASASAWAASSSAARAVSGSYRLAAAHPSLTISRLTRTSAAYT